MLKKLMQDIGFQLDKIMAYNGLFRSLWKVSGPSNVLAFVWRVFLDRTKLERI